MQRQKKKTDLRSGESGFTLVEIMVVVVIIGLLAGLVGPKIFRNLEKANYETAKTQMTNLKTALSTYRLDMGRYPDQLNCLINPCGDGWAGPYLDGDEIPLDPWKAEYQYSVGDNGKAFTLTSSGGGNEPIVVNG
ncbi:type II secretion system major pseudopilin GspG [bacterium]|nr:type II secretion system major pseudopilin GspG [candidate division CSSED10-310 bacterium]